MRRLPWLFLLMRHSAAAVWKQHLVNSANHKWINVISWCYPSKQWPCVGQRAPCFQPFSARTQRLGSMSDVHSCKHIPSSQSKGKTDRERARQACNAGDTKHQLQLYLCYMCTNTPRERLPLLIRASLQPIISRDTPSSPAAPPSLPAA